VVGILGVTDFVEWLG